MPDADIAFYLTQGGMNAASPAARVPETQYTRLVNGRIVNSLPTTRCGCRIIPLSGDNLEFFSHENVQGALYYNPADGQGAVTVGKDDAMLAVAMGGRKFVVRIEGRGYATVGKISDLTNGLTTNGNLHLVFLSQWENYLVAGDGSSRTFIYDGTNPATASNGYNTTNKEMSRIPNAGTVMCYSHGRGSVVVNGRFVLTGDLAFSTSFTSASDLLNFKEQVYWATGQYFAAQTKMGTINAAAVLPIKDTAHGHGETIFHCERGVFSVDLNIFPRSSWAESPMVKDVYLGSGAVGPYAIASRDGDQIFRTTAGVKTLRSARSEASALGSPESPISRVVESFFAADTKQYLRFATVATWEDQRRAFVTCYPIVDGRFWTHRGMVSLNFDPVPEQQSTAAWEGLWTVPVEAGRITTMVSGTWSGLNRFIVICRNAQGLNQLLEFDPSLPFDVLADGTLRAIRCQLISRRMDVKRPFSKKNFQSGSLFLTKIEGRVDWGVWYRVTGQTRWKLWQSGYVSNGPYCGTVETLAGNAPADPGIIELGELPTVDSTSRFVQFLVRWAGNCSVESIRLTHGTEDADAGRFEPNRLALCVPLDGSPDVDYNDYEYSETTEDKSWLDSLPHKKK